MAWRALNELSTSSFTFFIHFLCVSNVLE